MRRIASYFCLMSLFYLNDDLYLKKKKPSFLNCFSRQVCLEIKIIAISLFRSLTRGKKTIIPFKNKYKLTCELNKTKKSGNLRPFPNFNKFINSKSNNSNFRDDCTESLLKMADTFRPIVLLAVYFIHYSLAGQE